VCWRGGIVVDVAIVEIPQLLGTTKLGIGEEGGNGNGQVEGGYSYYH